MAKVTVGATFVIVIRKFSLNLTAFRDGIISAPNQLIELSTTCTIVLGKLQQALAPEEGRVIATNIFEALQEFAKHQFVKSPVKCIRFTADAQRNLRLDNDTLETANG